MWLEYLPFVTKEDSMVPGGELAMLGFTISSLKKKKNSVKTLNS